MIGFVLWVVERLWGVCLFFLGMFFLFYGLVCFFVCFFGCFWLFLFSWCVFVFWGLFLSWFLFFGFFLGCFCCKGGSFIYCDCVMLIWIW